jgi:hypothetical protein
MSTPLSARVQKASEILGVDSEKIMTALASEGIDDSPQGIMILDSPTTNLGDINNILFSVDKALQGKNLKVRVAAAIIKDADCERPRNETVVNNNLSGQSIAEALKAVRPIQQWNDRELLEKYAQDRDPEIEQELHKRANSRHFVVLKKGKFEQGKEEIDIENTLDLLKLARKKVTPSFIPLEDGVVAPVYYITELNMVDRLIELCPICGETLFKGFCEKCQVNFSGVGDDERAYVKLIADMDDINSRTDRKDVVTSASKGLEDLKLTWPTIAPKFDELKLTNSLPKLRIISSRPNIVSDPFFQDGNRAFGNRQY